LENLKPVVWPVGQPYGKGYQEYPSCPSFTKKGSLFLSPFFCCVVPLPSNTMIVRKTYLVSLPCLFLPFSALFFFFKKKAMKKDEKGWKRMKKDGTGRDTRKPSFSLGQVRIPGFHFFVSKRFFFVRSRKGRTIFEKPCFTIFCYNKKKDV